MRFVDEKPAAKSEQVEDVEEAEEAQASQLGPTHECITQMHTLVGNDFMHAALSGEHTEGMGTVLRGFVMSDLAGLGASGAAGFSSNRVMLRLMRHASTDGAAEAAAEIVAGHGRPMPDGVKLRMERAFGRDFGHVRIHDDSAAEQSARVLNAHAFTTGTDIYFGRGKWAPGTPAGDRLLAHELTHVVQHDQGRLPTQIEGGVSSPSDPAEREAYQREGQILGDLERVDAAIAFETEMDDGIESIGVGAEGLGAFEGEAAGEGVASGASGGPVMRQQANERENEEDELITSTPSEAHRGMKVEYEISMPSMAGGGYHYRWWVQYDESAVQKGAREWRYVSAGPTCEVTWTHTGTHKLYCEVKSQAKNELGLFVGDPYKPQMFEFEHEVLPAAHALGDQGDDLSADVDAAHISTVAARQQALSDLPAHVIPEEVKAAYSAAESAKVVVDMAIQSKEPEGLKNAGPAQRAAFIRFFEVFGGFIKAKEDELSTGRPLPSISCLAGGNEPKPRATGLPISSGYLQLMTNQAAESKTPDSWPTVLDLFRVACKAMDELAIAALRKLAADGKGGGSGVDTKKLAEIKAPLTRGLTDWVVTDADANRAFGVLEDAAPEQQELLLHALEKSGHLDVLTDNIPSEWFQKGSRLTGMVDDWKEKRNRIEASAQDLENSNKLDANMRMAQAKPGAQKVAAMFYPDGQFFEAVDDEGQKKVVAQGIPWYFYLYKEGEEWVLEDVTSPLQVKTNRESGGTDNKPPNELFEELNTKLRFPKGSLVYRIPNGDAHVLTTTAPNSWGDWLQYTGMTITAIGLLVSSMGGNPAGWIMAGAAAGIAGTAADLNEKGQHGMVTNADIALASLSIVAEVLSAGAAGLGKLALTAKMAGKASQLAGKAFYVTAGLALAADTVTLFVFMDAALKQYESIDGMPEGPEKQKARDKFILTALLTGGIMAMALKGSMGDVTDAKKVMVDVDADGNFLLKNAADGADTPAAKTPGDSPAQASGDPLPQAIRNGDQIASASSLNVPVGRPIASQDEAMEIMSRLRSGDAGALEELGVSKLPEGYLTNSHEWGLGRMPGPDGEFVVIRGSQSSVDWNHLDVVPVAHSHPVVDSDPTPNQLLNADGVPGEVSLDDVLAGGGGMRDNQIHLFPSGSDVVFCADRGLPSHHVLTPYEYLGEGRIGNFVPGSGNPRITFEIEQPTRVGTFLGEQDHPIYRAEAVMRAEGEVPWKGSLWGCDGQGVVRKISLEQPQGLVPDASAAGGRGLDGTPPAGPAAQTPSQPKKGADDPSTPGKAGPTKASTPPSGTPAATKSAGPEPAASPEQASSGRTPSEGASWPPKGATTGDMKVEKLEDVYGRTARKKGASETRPTPAEREKGKNKIKEKTEAQAKAESANKAKKAADDEKRIQTMKDLEEVDKRLVPRSRDAASQGHGHKEHGYKTPMEAHEARVKMGKKPGGGQGEPAKLSTKFYGPDQEMEALEKGRVELDRKLAKGNIPEMDKDGKPNKVHVRVSTDRPRGFGGGYKAKVGPDGHAIKLGPDGQPLELKANGKPVDKDVKAKHIAEPVKKLKTAKVVYQFNPKTGEWQELTYHPE